MELKNTIVIEVGMTRKQALQCASNLRLKFFENPEEFKMEYKELVETVAKEAEITEEQTEICLNTVSDFFTTLSEDELTDLLDLYEELVE